MEYLLRFLIGGLVVSAFAVIGDTFRPRSFSGLFGAAPTVALSTLGLVFAMDGAGKVALETRSMLAGAAAFFIYTLLTRAFILNGRLHSLLAALLAYLAWFAVALGLYFLFLK